VVRRYTPVAHRTAVLLGAGADADDVVQEAFVKAYRALPTFRDGASFRPWLLRIVANETRNQYRTSSRRRAREHIAEDPALLFPAIAEADPAETAISRERRQALLAALLTVPEAQRTVLTCRYLLDLDETETAAVLGIARGTVKSRHHRGLRNLRACLPIEHAAGPTEGGGSDG
jgi:RNA polymerase sigma-70 factor (ECF subfamily)